MSMALLKGPELLNTEPLPIKSSSTGSGSKTWLLGSIILFGNICSIVIWKIMQGTTLLSNVQTSATVIGTVLAATFLHEVIYTSSLLGAIVVISGLYMVISGQASDQQEIKQETNFVPQADGTNIQQGSMDESTGHNICKKHLEEPLLYEKLPNVDKV
ncbi:hypothetical protein H0E87_029407 [Populus deltoides]|uniref:Uncharacterized protein n=1 Tax=Populus deltoides TaxID=3696 RepID=A0A8T2WM50_POPDE|nr:hypothetical protein H0E87_029407 [Populus deltoides]